MPAPLKKSKKASHKLYISLYIEYIKNYKSIRERQLSRKTGKLCMWTGISQKRKHKWWINLKKMFNFLFFFFPFIFISWRLITLQYCSGFCYTLTWISHGFTCIPHPDPPSHLPLYPIPLGPPSAPGPSTCLMHPAWAGDLFHHR